MEVAHGVVPVHVVSHGVGAVALVPALEALNLALVS